MKKIIQKINTLTTFLFFPLISFAAALPDGKATNPSLSASKNLYQVFSFTRTGYLKIQVYSFLINEEKMLAIEKNPCYEPDKQRLLNKDLNIFSTPFSKSLHITRKDIKRSIIGFFQKLPIEKESKTGKHLKDLDLEGTLFKNDYYDQSILLDLTDQYLGELVESLDEGGLDPEIISSDDMYFREEMEHSLVLPIWDQFDRYKSKKAYCSFNKRIKEAFDLLVERCLKLSISEDQLRKIDQIIHDYEDPITKIHHFERFIDRYFPIFMPLYEVKNAVSLYFSKEPLKCQPQADWHIHQHYNRTNIDYAQFFNDSKAKCLEELKEEKPGGRWHAIKNEMRISELERLITFFKHPGKPDILDESISFFSFGELPFYPFRSIAKLHSCELPVSMYTIHYRSYSKLRENEADGYYAEFMQKDSLSVWLKYNPLAPTDILYPHQLCAPEEICDRLNHEDPLAFFMRTSFLDCDRLSKPQSLLSLDSTFTKSLLSIEPCGGNIPVITWWENDQKRAIVYQTVLLGYLSNLHEVFHYFEEGEDEGYNYFDFFNAAYMFNELSSYELAESFQVFSSSIIKHAVTYAISKNYRINLFPSEAVNLITEFANKEQNNMFFGTTAQTDERSQELISLKLHIGPDTYKVKPKEKNTWPLYFTLLLIANK